MTDFTKEFIAEARESITEPGVERYICIPVQLEMLDEIERLQSRIAELEDGIEIMKLEVSKSHSCIAELEAAQLVGWLIKFGNVLLNQDGMDNDVVTAAENEWRKLVAEWRER